MYPVTTNWVIATFYMFTLTNNSENDPEIATFCCNQVNPETAVFVVLSLP